MDAPPGDVVVSAGDAGADGLYEDVCVAVPGSGGIIGLFRSDRARINDTLNRYSHQGYRMVHFSRSVDLNIVYRVMQLICLGLTLMLWCPNPGGLLFFQRRTST